MNYQPMSNYPPYQPMPQPYADRLAQLQSNYQQAVNVPQVQQPTQINQGLLWVSGEVGAKSYLVAPNSTVLLMDSDAQRFYLKSADGAGMPSLKIFEYNEVTAPSKTVQTALISQEKELSGKFVTREEYEALKRQYENIMERLDSMVPGTEPVEPTTKSTKSRTRGGNGDE